MFSKKNLDAYMRSTNPRYKTGGVTSSKAKEILRDGTAHGKPLTSKQKKFFGAMAGKSKYAVGGEEGDEEGGRVSNYRRGGGKAPAKSTKEEVMAPFRAPVDLDPAYTPEKGRLQDVQPTMASNPVDQEVYAWTKDYINSPKYRERLSNFYQYPDYIKKERYKKASNVGFTETPGNSVTAYSDTSAWPNQLNVDTKQLKLYNIRRDEAAAHELGHLSNAGVNKSLQLSTPEDNFVFARNTLPTKSKQYYQEAASKAKMPLSKKMTDKSFMTEESHDTAPSETMSDVQALRFMMNKQKIYDARTQDLTPTQFNKALKDSVIKDSETIKRLRSHYKDADLIDIMNKVAKAETNLNKPEVMAALGGIIHRKAMKRYAGGGEVGSGWSAAASAIPAVGNLVDTLINKPSVYNNQPVMNAQTIHNMDNPYDTSGLKYAMGGEMDDVDDDKYFEWLEQMFDNTAEAEQDDQNQNVSQDVLQFGQENDEEGWDENDQGEDEYAAGYQFATGGIYIKPSKRGTFTAAAKKHGKSVQGFARQVLANKGNYSTAMVKKANFARNAAKWKHAYGGYSKMLEAFATGGIHINPANKGKFTATKKRTGKTTEELTHSSNPLTRKRAIFAQNARKWKHAEGGMSGNSPIEVEGEEIVETPDGQMQQMQGPSHEEGGITMNVPEGTKIYSDRLQLEGKSMQERKKSRENRLAVLDKILEKNPTDQLTKNTYKRTKMQIDLEDAQDMELQKAANEIYQGSIGKRAMGGKMYAEGGPVGPYGFEDPDTQFSNYPYTQGLDLPVNAGTSTPSTSLVGKTPTLKTTPVSNGSPAEQTYKDATGLTTGDYIGLGANLFGAIAPIVNTRNAARNTRPVMNRYVGAGHEAIEANEKAQELVGSAKANAMRDLDTTTGTAFARNRGGARGINTMRALDSATDYNRMRTQAQINQNANQQMIGLLGQRGQLTNWRDQVRAAGQTQADDKTQQNIDNYYSNMAENLSNFATQAGNIGRNLNINKANKDNTNLLESMSEYFDFGRDNDGNLVLKKKGK